MSDDKRSPSTTTPLKDFDAAAFVPAYRALAEKLANNPDYFNADLAKALFREYGASNEARRGLNDAVTPYASRIAFAAFEARLTLPPPQAQSVATLTAGGTGSGKSVLRPERGIVYDSTMYELESAKRNMRLVIDSRRSVNYSYVFTVPESAFHEMIQRGKNIGRYVNLTAFVRTHQGAYSTVQALMEAFEGDPRVRFTLFGNTQRAAGEIQKLPGCDYNGLRERLQVLLDAEYTAGRIDDAEYVAIARTDAPVRTHLGDAGRGHEGSSGVRPGKAQGLVEAIETPPEGWLP